MQTLRIKLGWFVGILLVVSATVQVAEADNYASLAAAFSGYTISSYNQQYYSGLTSSYYTPTVGAELGSQGGTYLPNYMFTLGGTSGTDQVLYSDEGSPNNVPSPGYCSTAIAGFFVEGGMGVKDGGNLVVRIASTLNPNTGYYDGQWWHTTYGLGDVFLTVQDKAGVSQFALLNNWPGTGTPYTPTELGGGYFNAAENFHLYGSATATSGGTDLEGDLVSLTNSNQVAGIGGPGSYDPASYYVPGLDYRVYAQGGTPLYDAGLRVDTTTDTAFPGTPTTYYIETWTVPISYLSSDDTFNIGLHQTFTCGNDQIGLLATVSNGSVINPANVVPVPGAVGLAAIGFCCLRLGRRVFRLDAGRAAK
jgi:hypothetical protein